LTDEYEDGKQNPSPNEGQGIVRIGMTPAERQEAEHAREKKGESEYKKAQISTQRGILLTQFLLIFFGAIGSGVSIYQASTAKDSADEAKRAADLASDSFQTAYGEHGIAERTMQQMVDQTVAQVKSAEATETAARAAEKAANVADAGLRPWIKIENVELGPGAGGEGGIHTLMFHWPKSGLSAFPQFAGKELPPQLQIQVDLSNIGHSPATDIRIVPEFYFHHFDGNKWSNDILSEQRRFCGLMARNNGTPTNTIEFPNEPLKDSMGIGSIPIKPEDITTQEGARFSSAAVLLCVQYKSGTVKYQTQTWFGLYEDRHIAIPIGNDVDMDRLELIREPSGDHAN
jgi:hypothetical protein